MREKDPDFRRMRNAQKDLLDSDLQRQAEWLLRERQLTDHSLGEVLALGKALHEGMLFAAAGLPDFLAWAQWNALAPAVLARYDEAVQRGMIGQALFVAEGGWSRSERLAGALEAAGILPTVENPNAWIEYRAGAGATMAALHRVVDEARAGKLAPRLAL